MSAPTEPDLDGGFSELIGVEDLGREDGLARARVAVGPKHMQPFGVVHGGVYSTLAETLCSRATYERVRDDGMLAFGQSISATFVRPIAEGHVNATARARHRGRTTWVWQVEITDDEDRLCGLVEMVVAVREPRG